MAAIGIAAVRGLLRRKHLRRKLLGLRAADLTAAAGVSADHGENHVATGMATMMTMAASNAP